MLQKSKQLTMWDLFILRKGFFKEILPHITVILSLNHKKKAEAHNLVWKLDHSLFVHVYNIL